MFTFRCPGHCWVSSAVGIEVRPRGAGMSPFPYVHLLPLARAPWAHGVARIQSQARDLFGRPGIQDRREIARLFSAAALSGARNPGRRVAQSAIFTSGIDSGTRTAAWPLKIPADFGGAAGRSSTPVEFSWDVRMATMTPIVGGNGNHDPVVRLDGDSSGLRSFCGSQ
ncbi:hypothetical protein FAIPA1_560012 [Frankia sp. AiPs1]